MSANEREEDITVTDLSAEEAFEAGDCIFDEEQYNQPGQPRSFYEATMKQLGPLIQDCSCASLLRDTTISPDAGKALSHQLKFVHRKAIAVNKYCEFQLARLDDLDHIIHAVLARSKETPSKAVRTDVGSILDGPLSGVQVGRYLSEYMYFDAVAHNMEVTHSQGLRARDDEEPLYGHALGITPGGKGGFHMDRRGQHDHNRNWIFYETDLKHKCQRYMLGQKGGFL